MRTVYRLEWKKKERNSCGQTTRIRLRVCSPNRRKKKKNACHTIRAVHDTPSSHSWSTIILTRQQILHGRSRLPREPNTRSSPFTPSTRTFAPSPSPFPPPPSRIWIYTSPRPRDTSCNVLISVHGSWETSHPPVSRIFCSLFPPRSHWLRKNFVNEARRESYHRACIILIG